MNMNAGSDNTVEVKAKGIEETYTGQIFLVLPV
jgi:hypothetical protein